LTNLETAELPPRPDKYLVERVSGLTSVPKVAMKADGTDQAVTGDRY
jgi:hypothetical protein